MCHKQHIGETDKTPAKRFKEYTDGNHPIYAVQEHIDLTGHPVAFDFVKMLCKEDKTKRKVKESIEIYKHGPAMNRDHSNEIPRSSPAHLT